MHVKDLQARQGKVDLVLDITDKGEIREFNKFGKAGRVCNAQGKDESGSINITLWNDDIDKVNTGNKIKITNGYVNEWQGELQLTTGKFGQLEVLDDSTAEPSTQKEPAPSQETIEPADADIEPVSEEEKVE